MSLGAPSAVRLVTTRGLSKFEGSFDAGCLCKQHKVKDEEAVRNTKGTQGWVDKKKSCPFAWTISCDGGEVGC